MMEDNDSIEPHASQANILKVRSTCMAVSVACSYVTTHGHCWKILTVHCWNQVIEILSYTKVSWHVPMYTYMYVQMNMYRCGQWPWV